jgi:flagellar secretion chaperone FliS
MPIGQTDVAEAYARTAQSTVEAGPMLLVRLYDRLAHELELGKEFIQAGDAYRANGSLQHAQKIVHVLRSSLDPGGFEGGDTLLRLYNTLIDLLVKANLYKDIKPIEVCQGIVAPLREAWTEAVTTEMQTTAEMQTGDSDASAVGVG